MLVLKRAKREFKGKRKTLSFACFEVLVAKHVLVQQLLVLLVLKKKAGVKIRYRIDS